MVLNLPALIISLAADDCVLSTDHSNPPLSEEMLPPGEWMCHRCNVRKKVSGRSFYYTPNPPLMLPSCCCWNVEKGICMIYGLINLSFGLCSLLSEARAEVRTDQRPTGEVLVKACCVPGRGAGAQCRPIAARWPASRGWSSGARSTSGPGTPLGPQDQQQAEQPARNTHLQHFVHSNPLRGPEWWGWGGSRARWWNSGCRAWGCYAIRSDTTPPQEALSTANSSRYGEKPYAVPAAQRAHLHHCTARSVWYWYLKHVQVAQVSC